MGDREVPVHYLAPNEREWTPPSVIFLDTETRTIDNAEQAAMRARLEPEDYDEWVRLTKQPEMMTLRLWVACRVDRRPSGTRSDLTAWGDGSSGADLADFLCSQMVGRRTVWLYAHNLNFDLTTTRLPEEMVERGWRVGDFALSDKSVWMRLRKGEKTLTISDSWTYLPESLGSIAERLGEKKVPLPRNDDGRDEWLDRCQQDVKLLARAILQLMDWWETSHLGNWTITGPACGWNAARHRMRPNSIVIDPDPEAKARDRLAVKGGRRDVTRVGKLTEGPFVYIDFESAYPTIAAHLPLPVKRGATFQSLPLDSHYLENRRFGVVAEVEIETKVPRYPFRFNGVTWYPTGRFKTTLAGPDIAWARENGDLVSVGPGQAHKLRGALAEWARWVLSVQSDRTGAHPPTANVAAKHWGRTVIGKFGSHTGRTTHLGPALHPGWHYEPGRDRGHDCRASLVDLGGERWWVLHDQEPDNAYPAILAFVEAHVRVRLGRMLDELSEYMWVQADTDGILVDVSRITELVRGGFKLGDKPRDGLGAAAALCDHLAPLTWPLVPRPKAMWETVEVIGPQHLMGGGSTKLSGIPRSAKVNAEGKMEARTWPGILWQMQHGDREGYVRPMSAWTIPATTAHRWVTAGGSALPVEARIGPDGVTELTPWAETAAGREGVTPAAVQVAGLRGLY